MDLERTFEELGVPRLDKNLDPLVGEAVVTVSCAVLGYSSDRIQIEYNGTVYEVPNSFVKNVLPKTDGVVTASGKGKPAQLVLDSDAELVSFSRIRAKDLESHRPFVLARPSKAAGIFHSSSMNEHDDAWLRERGIHRPVSPDGTMSAYYCPSTSPGTSDNGGDNWQDDDSNNDGQHPDD